jgi:GH24 family phage-related lysozyme (muramidase)
MPINKIVATKRGKAAIAAVVAAAVGGMVALFPDQPPVHDDVALASAALVQPWEGRKLVAYLDRLAKPPLLTICDGDTTDVKPGMRETPEGCNKRLATKMEKNYRPPLVSCRWIGSWDKRPLSWRGMMLSLAWNIGPDAACNSTAAKLGGKGQYKDSCMAATAFNKAGGQVYIGLVRRREMGDATRIGEAELCVSGL